MAGYDFAPCTWSEDMPALHFSSSYEESNFVKDAIVSIPHMQFPLKRWNKP